MTALRVLRLEAWSAVMPPHHKDRATPSEGPARSPEGSRAATAGGRQRRLPMRHIARTTLPTRRTRHAIRRVILL